MKTDHYNIRAVMPYLAMSALGIACLSYVASGGTFVDINKINLTMIAIGGTCFLFSMFYLPIGRVTLRQFGWNHADIAILLWLVFASVNALITNPYFTKEGYFTLVIGILCYIACRLMLLNFRKKLLSAFLLTLGVLTAIEGIIAVLQFIALIPSLNNFFPVTGTFKNPAPLALFLSACLPVIYYSFEIVRRAWLKILFAFDLLLCLFVICISGNRASYLAIAVTIIFYALLLFRTTRYFVKLSKSWLLKVIIILSALCTLLSGGYYLYQLKPVSADGRVLIWNIASSHMFERPVFGAGIGSFQANYSNWQAMYFSSHADSRLLSDTSVSNIAGYVRLAYNEYLEILLEQGIIGLILFLSICYFALRAAFPVMNKVRRSVMIPVVASLLTILAQSFISYPLHSLPSVILMFILLAVITNETQPDLNKGYLTGVLQNRAFIMFSLLLAGIWALFFGISRFHNYNTYLSARNLFSRDRDLSGHLFEGLSSKLSNDPNFLIDYSIYLASKKEYNAAISNLEKASKLDGDPQIYILLGDFYTKSHDFESAEKCYKKACLIIPSLIYPKYALVKILVERHRIDDAKFFANSILNIKTKAPNEESEKMTQEIRLFLSKN